MRLAIQPVEMRILVVGPSNRDVWDLVRGFRAEGHGAVQIQSAGDAMEVLRSAPASHFDLLVIAGFSDADSEIDELDLAGTCLVENLVGRCLVVGESAPELVRDGLRLMGVPFLREPVGVEEILAVLAPGG